MVQVYAEDAGTGGGSMKRRQLDLGMPVIPAGSVLEPAFIPAPFLVEDLRARWVRLQKGDAERRPISCRGLE